MGRYGDNVNKIRFFMVYYYGLLIAAPRRRFKVLSDPRLVKGINASIDPAAEISFTGDAGSLVLGDGAYLGPRVMIAPPEDGEFFFGRFSSINADAQLHGYIEIGAYCVIASHLYMSSGAHHFRDAPWDLIKNQDQNSLKLKSVINRGQIKIGEDVWIGRGVFIGRGVTIGRGAIIGANAVVNHDVPPYGIVAGVPGKILGKRFDFLPPSMIDARLNEHLPYCYQGFEQMSHERLKDGLAIVGNKASLAMSSAKKDKLKVQFSNLKSGEIKVSYNGTKVGTGCVTGDGSCEIFLSPDLTGGVQDYLILDFEISVKQEKVIFISAALN